MGRVPECHPDRKHQGHGLCTSCYSKQWQKKNNRGKGRVYTYNDLTGKMYGNWKVVGLAEGRYKHGGMLWLCECQCDLKTRTIKGTALLTRGKPNQSCGCKARNKLRPYEALYNRLLYDGKWNRRARTVHFSYEEFLRFVEVVTCHYCGDGIRWTMYNLNNSSAYHLDRKDNNVDYTVDNCVVCCERCNKSKRDWFSYEEWLAMTEYLRKRRAQ